MKAQLYWSYTTRSLRRGGNRTLLATFCVGVGVMAIVGLQLAAAMVTASLTSNVRVANGGDLSVVSVAVPMPKSELTTFQRYQSQGLLKRFTAVQELSGTLIRPSGQGISTTVDAIRPSQFPLVGSLPLRSGALGTFHQEVSRRDTVVLSGSVASLLGVSVGRRVHVNLPNARHQTYWKVGGILLNSPPAGLTNDVFVSRSTLYSDVTSAVTPEYGEIYATTKNSAAAERLAKRVRDQLPLATVSTVKQALNSDKNASQQLTQFLSVAGLAALLIGGIGIINTMQVSLARRRLEIAMLKATGYRRRDLYGLFGLEAALLGLVAGIGGAIVGIGLSDAVRLLVENIANIQISFLISWEVVLAGVGIGVATSCIFALLPIVRLSQVRPALVLRDQNVAASAQVVGSTLLLLAVVAILFWLLASAILNSASLAAYLVIGTGVAIAILTGIFSLALWVVGRLPVPERMSGSHFALVTVVLLIGLALLRVPDLEAVGILVIVASALGYWVAFAPKQARSVVRMALRNSGRQRTRTAGTAVALFVGVFAVGLILVLGTDIRTELDSLITQATDYNVVAVAPAHGSAKLVQAAKSLHPAGSISTLATISQPLSVNGRPVLSTAVSKGRFGRTREGAFLVSGIQGFNLASVHKIPVRVVSGRSLRAGDAAINGVLLPNALRRAPYHLRTGDKIVESNPFVTPSSTVTLEAVGFYSPLLSTGKHIAISTTVAPVIATDTTVRLLGGSSVERVIELKFPANRADAAATKLRRADPAAEVINLADFTLIIDQFLNNAILFLSAIASLALLAGIVIIANSVALSLLERRREIGVQKAVGLSNRSVLWQVLTETATTAWLGATFGIAAIAATLLPLSRLVLKVSFGIPPLLALAIVAGAVLVAIGTATLVAWGPIRVRPLEVLRYE